jgi:hypothetical protein
MDRENCGRRRNARLSAAAGGGMGAALLHHMMHLLLHLDRRYAFSETPHRSMRTLAIHLFATAFSESERTLLNGFLQLIADEREGNYIDRNQVSAVRDIALQMHLTGRTDCSR